MLATLIALVTITASVPDLGCVDAQSRGSAAYQVLYHEMIERASAACSREDGGAIDLTPEDDVFSCVNSVLTGTGNYTCLF